MVVAIGCGGGVVRRCLMNTFWIFKSVINFGFFNILDYEVYNMILDLKLFQIVQFEMIVDPKSYYKR